MGAEMTAVGLFAGIGGIERGLAYAGMQTELLCEIDPARWPCSSGGCRASACTPTSGRCGRFPGSTWWRPGFPARTCPRPGHHGGSAASRAAWSITSSGSSAGAAAARGGCSSRTSHSCCSSTAAGRCGTSPPLLEDMGYRWAYRVVDARAFGLPQRRLRVLLLASRTEDPRRCCSLTTPRHGRITTPTSMPAASTGQKASAGWDGRLTPYPPSRAGRPSASPARPRSGWPGTAGWSPRGSRTPSGCRAFQPDGRRQRSKMPGPGPGTDGSWPATPSASRRQMAWQSAGRARDLRRGRRPRASAGRRLAHRGVGPDGVAYRAAVGQWPARRPYRHLEGFLRDPAPLSQRATAGFLRRAETSSLRFVDGFLDDVRDHLRWIANPALSPLRS